MLRVHDTRTGRKVPLRGKEVRMYVCGPTVYAPAHMGHARAYVAFDVVRRYLESRGLRVRYVVNVTDVEEAVSRNAAARGEPWEAFAERLTAEFLEDMRALRVRDADAYPRVSGHIPEILAVVEDLVRAGKAYERDGSVYVDTGGRGFGGLSHADPEAAIVGEAEAGDRRHPLDFAVWRRAKPGLPSWDSPWGPGYPGWHVECYAMATKHLGRVDVHGGGRDLIYPHHESENVIARAHAGRDLARVWMHNGWLTLEWKKMSKSLGNLLTVREVLEDWPADVVRLCLAKAHYRANLEYDWGCFEQAGEELRGIRGANAHVRRLARGPDEPAVRLARRAERKFEAAMDDDLDATTAFATVLEFAEGLRELRGASEGGRAAVAAAMQAFGDVFGLDLVG